MKSAVVLLLPRKGIDDRVPEPSRQSDPCEKKGRPTKGNGELDQQLGKALRKGEEGRRAPGLPNQFREGEVGGNQDSQTGGGKKSG